LVATGQLLRTLDHKAPLAQIALSSDGTIAAVDDQGRVVVWSAASPTPQLQPQLTNGLTRAIAFSSDGQRFVASGTDTRIFPSLAGTIGLAQLTIDGPTGELRAVAFTRDGTAVITAGVDGLVQLWDADKGKLLGVRGTRGATIHALATSSDGLLWVGGADQLLRVWDIHAEERDVVLLGAVMRRTPWRLDDLDAVVRRSEIGED
jgi:WD40 repeat protein